MNRRAHAPARNFSTQSSSRLIALPHKFANKVCLNALRSCLWITSAFSYTSPYAVTTGFSTQVTISTCLESFPLNFSMRVTIELGTSRNTRLAHAYNQERTSCGSTTTYWAPNSARVVPIDDESEQKAPRFSQLQCRRPHWKLPKQRNRMRKRDQAYPNYWTYSKT